jgi:hypothetical protein
VRRTERSLRKPERRRMARTLPVAIIPGDSATAAGMQTRVRVSPADGVSSTGLTGGSYLFLLEFALDRARRGSAVAGVGGAAAQPG